MADSATVAEENDDHTQKPDQRETADR